MCVLQPISYSLLVAFCYRHLPPPKSKGLWCNLVYSYQEWDDEEERILRNRSAPR